MKRMKYIFICLIFGMLVLTGCQKNDEKIVEGTGVFFLNTEGTGLVKEAYRIKGTNTEEQIKELLMELQKETDCIDFVSVIPVGVEIEKWELRGSKLDLYFSVAYNDMDEASEILLRAAIVQTMTQIKDVEYVAFYAAGQPVTDQKGNEIGYQSEEDFVQNIGSSLHSYQKVELDLYFANKENSKLAKETVTVRYNSNMSVEKLIVEELIDGTSSQKLQETFSPKTKILGVSVKDGICYVNFDEGFLTSATGVDPTLTIYSVVNSIVEGGNATKVQFLVNGEANVMYQDTIDLSQPFSRNLDIIEEEE